MPSIHLRACSYAHLPTEPVLVDVDLDVHADPVAPTWVGVVGANGSGKSTLLRLVAGELTPTSGDVHRSPGTTVALVPQVADHLPTATAVFARDWDGTAQRLRRRLGLDPLDLEPAAVDAGEGRGWAALSPGLRTRWLVATALAARPDVLLLDEPSNHLDAAGRDVLVAELRRFGGLGLVVSHDRTLLDGLTTRTVRVEGGSASLHPGSYGDAAPRWRAAAAAERAALDAAERERRRERAVLADLRRDRSGAERTAARRRREAGHRDTDAREAGRRFAADKAEAALARRVGAQRSRLERATAATGVVARDHRGAVVFREEDGRTGQVLAALDGEVQHAGGAVLLRDVDVALRTGDRVHVGGANGAGKSSLVAALLATVPADVTVAALGQDLEPVPAALRRLDRLDPELRGRVLGTAARLGVDPDALLRRGRASPGQQRLLALARLLVEPAALVVLDEPTNHLDLPAVEALQVALEGWAGTLLLVTHDHALAAATTTATWLVEGGAVTVRPRQPSP